jgi:phosphoribosylanthranilate isomerase
MKIKVCGMRDKNNIGQLIRLNPDYIGFIFHPESKRFVDTIEEDILAIIPESIKKVGVFVDEPINTLIEKYQRNKIDILQLHGNESPGYCSELKKLEIPVIKAFRIDEDFNFSGTSDYESSCGYFLFDTAGEKAGGNGIKFNWKLLSNYKGETPFFLSGGVGEEDLVSILQVSHSNFFGIDVNSKFETEPGKKDIGQLEVFFRKLRRDIRLEI